MKLRFAALALLMLAVLAPVASADHPNPGQGGGTDKLPPLLEGVTIEQKLGHQLPADIPFVDDSGKPVKIGDYFGDKPVVLTMNYFECPQLCPLVLDGTLVSLGDIPYTMGKDYQVVSVSIDPREDYKIAAKSKAGFVQRFAHGGVAQSGWHFLTGTETSIKALAEAVGFRYRFDPKTNAYSHPSGVTLLTPEGKVSRYFFGITYPVRDVRLGLVEASNNKIGTLLDQAMLFCYEYNPNTGQYGLVALNVMRIAGLLFVAGMVAGIIYLRRREPRYPDGLPGGIG